MPALDYQTAFQLAPVGMVMSRERVMVDVNEEAARIFGHPRTAMIGQSFELLYPTHDEYERTGARIVPIMNARGSYSDERIMKRANGSCSGAMSPAARWTAPGRWAKASGRSRICPRTGR